MFPQRHLKGLRLGRGERQLRGHGGDALRRGARRAREAPSYPKTTRLQRRLKAGAQGSATRGLMSHRGGVVGVVGMGGQRLGGVRRWRVRGGARGQPGGPGLPAGVAERAEAAGTEHAEESPLELLAEARVDDGVQAAVEVAQPEGHLEDRLRRVVGWEHGA